ncbi:hypothetical protein AAB988_24970 [Burkholderia contaminans]|uniref:hypothetical protein n=1 Tax=Burkholderia contaminans TaxID=488447 RepID=UPI0031182320
MFRPIAMPTDNVRVRSNIATRRPRLSALAFSLVAFASGYSHAAQPDLVLDNIVIKAGEAPPPSATGAGSIAIGPGAQAKGENGGDYSAIAIGGASLADGRATIAIGESSNVHGDRSVALGVGSNINANRALALGADASVTAHDAVALGQGSVADRGNTVSIGKSGNERQLVNLRAGTKDTDAVNLSQLKPAVEALGGGATIDVGASVRAPHYAIDGKSFNDVGSALTNLDDRATATTQSITTLDGRVTNVEGDVKSIRVDVDDLGTRINNGSTGLVRQDPASLAISIGADKGGTSVSVAGANGTRTLTGLSNGVGDTDAVTIAQLKATGLVDPDGKPLSALVYDDLSLGRATLGGVGGTLLDNVQPGAIVAGGMQAVNGG